ncbi:MAG TPA: hypothetical protein PLJ60_00330 [Chryseolinea sp.]|nr:hypothetical protein [Chryseolinea sp.]HPH45425.1 hypothetical protein [Chryseolinea sp.]HPM28752.1 hypothetical protein [Chryseolinea sp.]
MDLQAAWKNLDREKLSKPGKEEVEIRTASKHPVQKLIASFRYALGFIVLFEVVCIYLFIIIPQPIVRIFLALMIIIYALGFVVNYRTLRKIERHFVLDSNFKDSLQAIYDSTKTSLAFQRKAWIFIYPLAGTTGFLLGLSINTDVVEMIMKSKNIIILIITLAIVTPIGYYVAVWLENLSHGKYLNQLETLLTELNQAELV